MSAATQTTIPGEPLLVAVCQMTATADVDSNLETCAQLVQKAKGRGAKVGPIDARTGFVLVLLIIVVWHDNETKAVFS